MEITYKEAVMYAAIAGAVVGLVLGLVILFLGIKKNKTKLGIIGFIASIAVGPISGILSLIIAVVFLWLILRKTPNNISGNNASDSSESSNDEIA